MPAMNAGEEKIMTQPVNNRPSRVNREFEEAATSANVGKGQTSKPGPSAREVKQSQKPNAADGVSGLTQSGLGEAAATLAEGASPVVAGSNAVVFGPIMVAAAHLKLFLDAAREGEELRDAHARDAVNMAVVWTAGPKLPAAYVQRMTNEYRAVAGRAENHAMGGFGRGGANRILSRLMMDDAKWQQIKADAERSADTGLRFAKNHGITSKAALDQALRRDPKLAKAYEANIAFRHGLHAAIYEAQLKERAAR
jgi:hypothetical protein